jgi:hypothetical protein
MARRIDDLPPAELRHLLEMDPDDLPEPGAAELRDFLDRIGGIENAWLAIRVLEQLETPHAAGRVKRF